MISYLFSKLCSNGNVTFIYEYNFKVQEIIWLSWLEYMNKDTTLLLIRNFKGTKKKLCTNVYLYSCCIVYYVVSLTLAKISKCQLREEKKNIFFILQ